jgi:hypothetical protein
MRSFNYAPLKAALIFGLGVVVGGGFLGGFTHRSENPNAAITTNTQCISGQPVADFVCRNGWMGQHQYSYR